jgi:hypothetical protein
VTRPSKKKESTTAGQPRAARPSARGWPGRGRGYAEHVQAPEFWRGTTVQVCGLNPWIVGSGTPMIGVPIGRHITSGATVCADPISWFQEAKLISNPSAFVLGLPGLGKSTLIRRMAGGLAGFGTIPLILGDLKPDYVDLVEAMGGQVIRIGRGRGSLNVLDSNGADEAAERLLAAGRGDLAREVMTDARSRRHTMVATLITILRKQPPTDREETILERALSVLDERHDGTPVLKDLLDVIRDAPAEVRAVALDRGSMTRYQEITENLEASLVGLTTQGGRLAETFSHPTTTPMLRDRPVVYDISGIEPGASDLRAASLLACWSAGFGMVDVAHTLADAGLEPRRHYFVVLDELWQALRAGRGLVDRVDELTRLNRSLGTGVAMISHTLDDLRALPSEEDRQKAMGFVERAGMVVSGGLPASEMPKLSGVIDLSPIEQAHLTSWSSPPTFDPKTGREAPPPGQGMFLIKVGGRPGIPVKLHLTAAERTTSDTNKLWHDVSRIGSRGVGADA